MGVRDLLTWAIASRNCFHRKLKSGARVRNWAEVPHMWYGHPNHGLNCSAKCPSCIGPPCLMPGLCLMNVALSGESLRGPGLPLPVKSFCSCLIATRSFWLLVIGHHASVLTPLPHLLYNPGFALWVQSHSAFRLWQKSVSCTPSFSSKTTEDVD